MSSTTRPPVQESNSIVLEAPQEKPAPDDGRPAGVTPKYTQLQKIFYTPSPVSTDLRSPNPIYPVKIMSNGMWHASIGFLYTIARLAHTDNSDPDVIRSIHPNIPESRIDAYLEKLQTKDMKGMFEEDSERTEVRDAKYRVECRVDEEDGSDVVDDSPGLGGLELSANGQKCTDAEFEDMIAGAYD